jgi:hypothetical protein
MALKDAYLIKEARAIGNELPRLEPDSALGRKQGYASEPMKGVRNKTTGRVDKSTYSGDMRTITLDRDEWDHLAHAAMQYASQQEDDMDWHNELWDIIEKLRSQIKRR